MLFRFGVFELDPAEGELRRNGRRVAVQEQPMAVLLELVNQAGCVVGRDVLRQRLWPEGFHVDVDNGINTAIARVREALGDEAANPRFVATVPRRGYRFIAPVERVEEPADPLAGAETGSAAGSGEGIAYLAGSNSNLGTMSLGVWLLGAALLGVLLVMSVAWWVGESGERRPIQRSNLASLEAPETARANGIPGTAVRLAVLPFSDLTAHEETAQGGVVQPSVFGAGLTEELILLLGGLEPARLRVIARTSVMAYQTRAMSIGDIARELNVDFVLEGSVQREGDAIRTTVALVSAADQTRIWGAAYDRQKMSLLALEREIAREVGRALALELGLEPHGNVASSDFAVVSETGHELILEGNYFLGLRTEAGFRKAANVFEQATRDAPKSALAQVGLASAWAFLGIYDHALRDEAYKKAAAAAKRALVLDPDSAEAHLALAAVRYYYEWQFKKAAVSLARAIELNPSSAVAHLLSASLQMTEGNEVGTVTAFERALALDPLSPAAHTEACWGLFVVGREDSAMASCRRALELAPDFLEAWDVLKWIHIVRGEEAAAIEAFLRVVTLERLHALEVDSLRARAERDGVKALLEASLEHPEGRLAESGQSPYDLALDHAMLGNKEAALAFLERALRARETDLVTVAVDPRFKSLDEHVRFRALIERVGL